MIVAIALTAVVATMVIGSLVSVSKTLNSSAIETKTAGSASGAMRELTRVVRSGTEIPVDGADSLGVFLVAGARTVTLHAWVDTTSAHPKPVKIQFTVNAAEQLVETRWAAKVVHVTFWGFETTALSQRIVAHNIVTTPTAATATTPALPAPPAVFTYLDTAGAELVIPASGVLTAAQMTTVAAVKIRLTVQGDSTDRLAPVSLTNTVGITNLAPIRTDVAP